ncbi:MAG TPA: SAM-dependent methyltransferase [Alphaproteobacteria bacterium]|nr:SAM-dependent methyltransferase [Alphaproteobacteria bacterium]
MSDLITPTSVYLAAEGFVDDLCFELGEDVYDVFYDGLVFSKAPARPVVWADNVWKNPQFIEIDSIGDGAKKLKALQRNWANCPLDFHRRSQLLTEKLPHVSGKPLQFPKPLPTAPLGSWTMLREDLLLAATDCTSPVANGAYIFDENKEEPPNRAYLKLWEALTRAGTMPGAGDTCLDLGACPGGWTWVLQGLGAKVISVDKAPLAPNIAALPNIEYVQQSAFGLKPEDIGKVDWLFSDIICYPERLLRLVKTWKDSGLVRNMICTIKFQGETDHKTTESFLEIAGSHACHLYNNKHEITWFCLEDNT